MYKVVSSKQFKKDLKLSIKRGLDINLLNETIYKLANGVKLPLKNYDHELSGRYLGFRECHIQPNWLLIYRIENDSLILFLTRTGSHSDLLNN